MILSKMFISKLLFCPPLSLSVEKFGNISLLNDNSHVMVQSSMQHLCDLQHCCKNILYCHGLPVVVAISTFCSPPCIIDTFALDQGVDYVNCVKSTYRYYATDGANFRKEPSSPVEATGNFTCSPQCTRQWSSASLPETNLKLIKTDPACTCIKKDYDWQLTPSIGMIEWQHL